MQTHRATSDTAQSPIYPASRRNSSSISTRLSIARPAVLTPPPYPKRETGSEAPTPFSRSRIPRADNSAFEGRYVEAYLGSTSASQAVSNVIQFWTREQRMTLLGANGLTRTDFGFRPGSLAPFGQPQEDHWKNFDVEIMPGSMHGSSREQERNYWINLRAASVLFP